MKTFFLIAFLFTNLVYSQPKIDVNALEMLEITQALIEAYRNETRTPSQVLVRDKKTLNLLNVYEVDSVVLGEMDEIRDGISLIFSPLPNSDKYVIEPAKIFPFIALEESIGILNETLIANKLNSISILNLHRQSFFTVEQADPSRKKLFVDTFKEGQARKPFLSRLLLDSLIMVNITLPAHFTFGVGTAAVLTSFALPFMTDLDATTRFLPLSLVTLANLSYYAIRSKSKKAKVLLDTYKMEQTYKLLRKRGLLDKNVTVKALEKMGIYVEASTTGGYFKFGTGYKLEINDTSANFFISASDNGELFVDYKDVHKDIKRFIDSPDITATTTFMAKPFDKALAEIRENAILKSKAFKHLSGCSQLFI